MVLPWDHHLDRQLQISFSPIWKTLFLKVKTNILRNCTYVMLIMFLLFLKITNAFLSFLNIFNNQHKNIKFTVEHFSDFICFLGVKIKINHNSLDTYTWRKPTNTGLSLNFNAFILRIFDLQFCKLEIFIL